MSVATTLPEIRQRFIEATSRIAEFWGFPRAMGAIYGAIYLGPAALSLDDLVQVTQVSKGAVSAHVRALQRLQMIHRRVELGDRKDYYEAETQLWRVVKNVLAQRQKSEFEQALAAVRALSSAARGLTVARAQVPLKGVYVARLDAMKAFFDTLDGIVGAFLMLDELRLGDARKSLAALLRPGRAARRGES